MGDVATQEQGTAPSEEENKTQTNPLEMSDEDFLKMNSPEDVSPSGSEKEASAASDDNDDAANANTDDNGDANKAPDPSDDGVEPKEPADPEAGKPQEKKDDGKPAEEAVNPNPEKKDDPKPNAEASPAEKTEKKDDKPSEQNQQNQTPIDYKAGYEKIMAPFKANGKEIQARTPEEAIALMQQGANYTRRMQELQPYRKVITMLENNELLNEGDLSFLIDLHKKNPEAIKKLVKESGIDPMDIDVNAESSYQSGSHIVGDQEANFRSTLADITSQEGGREMLTQINSEWDDTSKQAAYSQPEILGIMLQQRQSGVYDIVTTEMNRMKTFGEIAPNTPFLQAYKMAGDRLEASSGGQKTEEQKTDSPTNPAQPASTEAVPAKEVVDTRAAAPKNPVANGDKASAASPTKQGKPVSQGMKNPLAMSDDEFLKSMEGRL